MLPSRLVTPAAAALLSAAAAACLAPPQSAPIRLRHYPHEKSVSSSPRRRSCLSALMAPAS